jgi:6-phosphofructokinase 1
VAEGAEEGLINPNEHITQNPRRDDSNNIIFDDIGKFLKEAIVKYAKDSHNVSLTLKYIDPTYAIRSVPSNAVDTIMCAKLAQNAVHGAMAGYTGFSVGIVRNTVCWIPVTTLIKAGTNRMTITDRIWQRLMSQNRQRPMVNEEFEQKAKELVIERAMERTQAITKIIDGIRYEKESSFGSAARQVEPDIDNA